jgi:Terminase RNaseH-like domain
LFSVRAAGGSNQNQRLKANVSAVIAVNPEGGKLARFMAMQPEWEAGDWYVARNAGWTSALIEQLVTFPNSRHDDMCDMLSQAAIWLQKRSSGPESWLQFFRQEFGKNPHPAQRRRDTEKNTSGTPGISCVSQCNLHAPERMRYLNAGDRAPHSTARMPSRTRHTASVGGAMRQTYRPPCSKNSTCANRSRSSRSFWYRGSSDWSILASVSSSARQISSTAARNCCQEPSRRAESHNKSSSALTEYSSTVALPQPYSVARANPFPSHWDKTQAAYALRR